MKKNDFKKLALMGFAGGLLVSGQAAADNVTEQELLAQLSTESKILFSKLSEQEQTAVMMLAAAKCPGKNGCPGQKNPKGSNAVASSCGGKSGCGSVASSCGGKGGCGSVASSCGGKGGCGSVASSCGGKGGCGSLTADRVNPPSTLPPTQDPSKVKISASEDAPDGNLGYHLLTEQELLIELNDDGIKTYKSLSPEGKELALKVASMRCQGTNECKGLNACSTDENDCAGKGKCKGLGKCAIADKNLAVQLVSKKMAEKRNGSLKSK